MGLKEFILVGHSIGGHIAIESINKINGVKGVMVLGTPAIGFPPEMDKMFFPKPVMGNLYAPKISNEEALKLSTEFVHQNDAVAIELSEIICATDGNTRTNLGASIGKGEFKNEKEILEKHDLPVAIVHGEKEKLVQWDYVNSLKVKNLWN